MHHQALQFVQGRIAQHPARQRVVEIGSRNINGSVRSAFAARVTYWGCDLVNGLGVDAVCAGQDADPPFAPDTVVCCEVLEHTPDGFDIIARAFDLLQHGGILLLTSAGIGRTPHSAVDGGPVRDGEYYNNIDESRLRYWLEVAGFERVLIRSNTSLSDIYAEGIKP